MNEKQYDSIQNEHLFSIARSKDSNKIYYDLQLDQWGNLDKSRPIVPYWIKYEEKGKRQDLTSIQQKYAYGLNFEIVTSEVAIFSFVSYPSRKLILKRDSDSAFRVHLINPEKGDVVLSDIFIQIEGGTFWVPNVTKVSLYGTEAKSSAKFEEHIIP